MSETSADVVVDIDKKLDKKLAELTPIPSERCIFRVHDRLRNENKKAYEPNVVAIGPYHHGKDNLKPMEEHKLRYLQQLLQRRNETSVGRYIVAMRESEQRARKFYAEPISLDSNEFVEMMLLDSCFIVELLRKFKMRYPNDPNRNDPNLNDTNLNDPNLNDPNLNDPNLNDPNLNDPNPNDPNVNDPNLNDPNFQIGHNRYSFLGDLMLFENQLPFFIVMQLFNMIQDSSDSLKDLVGMVVSFFVLITPGQVLPAPVLNPREDEIKHLLGLLHYCCCHEFHSMVSQRNIVRIEDESLKSTKQLEEAGIKVQKIEGRNLFNIRFVNGTMEIPTLQVEDSTESFLRNMIAYEQYLPDASRNHFTAYYVFMDYLVNTSEDVEILTHHGIIRNLLGDNEVVATMLNKLGNNIIESYKGYEEVYNNVNEHCRGEWNIWLAILRRKYFNNPWAFISFLAGVVLLLLTLLNTIFSIISGKKSK